MDDLRAYRRAYYLANRAKIINRNMAYRAQRREAYLKYQREYSRQYYQERRERLRAQHNAHYQTHRAWYVLRNAAQSRSLAQRARMHLQYLIRSGKVVRPTACENCQKPCKPHGHHYRGYSQPERVLWLCSMCHAEAHHH